MARSTKNPVVHLELHTGNLPRACAFYSALCGWTVERVAAGDGSYLTLDTGSTVGGGIVECEAGAPLWLPYVEVASITGGTRRAQELGATVLLEPREGPAGWRSIVSAPESGEIALWEAKRRR